MHTPLYDEHRALGAKMVEFAGWKMPVQYTGILVEHRQTRTACGVFDTCHMGEFELSGPTAEMDLERLLTLRVGTLAIGQCRYGYMLREDGGVLDDLTCYRLGPDRFWLIVNAGTRSADFEWLGSHRSSDTRLCDRSADVGKLDIQGPTSWRVLSAALGSAVPSLKYFRLVEVEWEGQRLVISRTGYTGEWGYEVYVPIDRVVAWWRRLLQCGAIPAGLGARDTLRMEMGYPLYGHELLTNRTPVAASRGAFVDLSKVFIGWETVKTEMEQGCARYLVGLRLDGRRAARPGMPVIHEQRVVGAVTSGTYAPSLETAIALAYVDAELAHEGQRLEVDLDTIRLRGTVVSLPFWKFGTARAPRPPGAST